LAEIYTVCLHNSYTAKKSHVICNENNMMQQFYHPLRMTAKDKNKNKSNSNSNGNSNRRSFDYVWPRAAKLRSG
jgi:hypothetical protein